MSEPKATPVFRSYWRFASERQDVYYKRLRGAPPPWTEDRVIAVHRFTNVFRASDRESQFLIREVIGREQWSPVDVFFRVILFRLFNRSSTWRLLDRSFPALVAAEFDPIAFSTVLEDALREGTTLFSAAYIMPSRGRGLTAKRKHVNLLMVLQRMLDDELPERIFDMNAEAAFLALRSYPMMGDFLAYQYLTDLGYTNLAEFEERDFVMPGPGARDGIRKCFTDLGGRSGADVIRWVSSNQIDLARQAGFEAPHLFGRPLQLIDCQNLFCEVDKYARIVHPEAAGRSGRKNIKQRFAPSPVHRVPAPVYPKRWGLDGAVESFIGGESGFPRVPDWSASHISVG